MAKRDVSVPTLSSLTASGGISVFPLGLIFDNADTL